MSPPQLAADTPVLNVAHPRKVGVFPLLGYELNGALFDSFDSGSGEFFCIDIPLWRQPRLYDGARAIASWHFEGMRLNCFE